MPVIAPTATLGEIVADHPETAPVFERFGLDYCCGGGATLADACATRGVDLERVRATLTLAGSADADDVLSGEASIAELCEHLVVRRHGPLRVELQRIGSLLDTVVRVHGSAHPELAELQERFAAMRSELDTHLRTEENEFFPACRALEEDAAADVRPQLLEHLRDDHDEVGAELRQLRGLAGDYDPATAYCATHRALLHALQEFETSMHRHVHEENNVLFPKVRERLGVAA